MQQAVQRNNRHGLIYCAPGNIADGVRVARHIAQHIASGAVFVGVGALAGDSKSFFKSVPCAGTCLPAIDGDGPALSAKVAPPAELSGKYPRQGSGGHCPHGIVWVDDNHDLIPGQQMAFRSPGNFLRRQSAAGQANVANPGQRPLNPRSRAGTGAVDPDVRPFFRKYFPQYGNRFAHGAGAVQIHRTHRPAAAGGQHRRQQQDPKGIPFFHPPISFFFK